MVQLVATLLFVLLAGVGMAVIAAGIVDEWSTVRAAFRVRPVTFAALPVRGRPIGMARTARIIRVTQTARRSAAA